MSSQRRGSAVANVMKTLTMTSVLGPRDYLLGLVSGLVMWFGGHSVLNHT